MKYLIRVKPYVGTRKYNIPTKLVKESRDMLADFVC